MAETMVTSSVLILLVLFLRAVFGRKISRRLQYSVWLMVAVKLLVFPVPWIESCFFVMSLIEMTAEQLETVRGEENLDPGAAVTDVEMNFIQEGEDVKNGTEAEKQVKPAMTENGHQNEENGGNVADTFEGWKLSDIPIKNILMGISVLGSIGMLLLLFFYNFRFYCFLKRNRMRFENCESRLPVYLVEGLPSPCFYGKAIYLTPEIIADERKMRHVLAHEYVHYKQGDGFWAWIRGLCLACYWWHPLVWAAAYASKQDCELSCDEAAIRLLGEEERISYCETLIGLVTVKTKPKDYFSMATTMTGTGKRMKQRISMIVRKPKVFISVCVVVILIAVLGFFGTITGAQREDVQKVKSASEGSKPEESAENGSDGLQKNEMQESIEKDESVETARTRFQNDIQQGYMTKLLKVYDISSKKRGILFYELVTESDEDSGESERAYSYEEVLNQAYRNGELEPETLAFHDSCKYYVADQVGSSDVTEITYDSVQKYFTDVPDDGYLCRALFKNGIIWELQLLNPYPEIEYSCVTIAHDFYETYGTDEFYTLSAAFEANIDHTVDAGMIRDGAETMETIEVYTGNIGDGKNGIVLLNCGVSANEPFSIEAHTARAGWNNIYLLEEEGYIFTLQIDIRDTYGCLQYQVFYLEEQAGTAMGVVEVSGASYSYDGIEDFHEESYQRWADAMESYMGIERKKIPD